MDSIFVKGVNRGFVLNTPHGRSQRMGMASFFKSSNLLSGLGVLHLSGLGKHLPSNRHIRAGIG